MQLSFWDLARCLYRGSLGCLLAGLGHLLGASWLSGTAPTSILGASGTNFEGPKAPILEDLASILSKRFHSIPFPAYRSISCHSTPFHSIPLRSIPFHSIPIHSIPLSFHSKMQVFDFPCLQFPIGLGGIRGA